MGERLRAEELRILNAVDREVTVAQEKRAIVLDLLRIRYDLGPNDQINLTTGDITPVG